VADFIGPTTQLALLCAYRAGSFVLSSQQPVCGEFFLSCFFDLFYELAQGNFTLNRREEWIMAVKKTVISFEL